MRMDNGDGEVLRLGELTGAEELTTSNANIASR
jgi:hypothetical protein